MTEVASYPIQEAIRLIKKAKTIYFYCTIAYSVPSENSYVPSRNNYSVNKYLAIAAKEKAYFIKTLEELIPEGKTKTIDLIVDGKDIFAGFVIKD